MNNKVEKVPFYKEIYDKVENELGIYDTLTGLAIGVAACMLYWRHCWKNH